MTPFNGTPPYQYLWSNGATTAAIRNLPIGTYSVKVTDSAQASLNSNVTLTSFAELTATSSQTNPSYNSTNGSASVSAVGGTGSYTYGWFPSGGTAATAIGLSAEIYTVTITDANGCWLVKSLNLTAIGPPEVTPVSATVAYGSTSTVIPLNITGGAPTSVAVSTGASHGMAIASRGEIRYTPTAGFYGADSFAYTATTADGTSSPAIVSVTVSAPTIVPSSTNPPQGTVGVLYNTTFTASGGSGPYSYSTVSKLPDGLVLSSAGVLSGTPTASGTFNLAVVVKDASTGAGPASATQSYQLIVGSPTISVNPTTLPSATEASSYSQAMTASGGIAPYTFAIVAGTLPTGLTLSSAGNIAGTPRSAGNYTFTVAATDSSNGMTKFGATQNYSMVVNSAVPTAGAVSVSVAYNSNANPITLALSGGAATSVAIGTNGLNGTATAVGTAISYTPKTGFYGQDRFTYTATNTTGASSPAQVTVTVVRPLLAFTLSSLAPATVGTAVNQTITLSGGASPYTFTSVKMPAWLSVAPSGQLSGTPTEAGSFDVEVSVTDHSSGDGPAKASKLYQLTVAAPTISVGPATLPALNLGSSFNETMTASGGTAPYQFRITLGNLPTGLTLNSTTGTVTGKPTVAGPYSFTVTATDSSTGTTKYTGSQAYSGSVGPGAPIASNVNASVSFGSSNNAIKLSLSGGAATSVVVATAPASGTATVNGTSISYTPGTTYAATDSFTYTATNAAGTSEAATVNITISKQDSSITVTSTPNPSNPGEAVTFTVAIAPATTTTTTKLAGAVMSKAASVPPAPTGTVNFTDNGNLIGSIDLANSTTFTTTALSGVGDHTIVVTYSGDTSNAGATMSFNQAVSAAAPVTPTATPVPTLNEWALILLGLISAALGALALRKRAGTTA